VQTDVQTDSALTCECADGADVFRLAPGNREELA
jgi:hypothetical protein